MGMGKMKCWKEGNNESLAGRRIPTNATYLSAMRLDVPVKLDHDTMRIVPACLCKGHLREKGAVEAKA